MSAGLTPDLDDPVSLARLFAPVADRSQVGLAVSGGGDSLALMLLARRWADGLDAPPRLLVYSLDHGLRPEAAAEVSMVLELAEQLGMSGCGLHWDGPWPDTGLQEAARTARYRLIGDAMREDGVEVLLTAHHRADQAETVLMRLAHGSGIEGLAGMAPFSVVEGVSVFRPLLDVEPHVLRDLVIDQGMVPVSDPSNDDPAYERVRWRRLLPRLAEEGLDGAAFARFARRMQEADDALAQMADAAFAELVRLDGFGAASLPVAALKALSPAIARRVLGRVIVVAGGRQKPRALSPVERLLEQVQADALPRSTTLLGAVIRVKGDALVVAREPGRALPDDQPLAARASLVWDERFRIVNSSDATDLVAGAADFFPRHRLEHVLGFKVTTPAEAIRTAPVVRDAAGGLLALGGWSFDERVSVEILID